MTASAEHPRYTRTAIAFHWTIAVLVVALLGAGVWMTRMTPGTERQFALYQLHKSLGILVLLLTLARLALRWAVPPPPLPDHLPAKQRGVARLVHGALLVLTLLVPMAGWAVVSASRWNIPTLLFGAIPWPHLPGLEELDVEAKKHWGPMLASAHAALAYLPASIAALHAAAALHHHWARGDAVLSRMLPIAGPRGR